jgi:hypothetical protein
MKNELLRQVTWEWYGYSDAESTVMDKFPTVNNGHFHEWILVGGTLQAIIEIKGKIQILPASIITFIT